MAFQLKLVPHDADECVLENEIPISGVDFLSKASALLRKSIDGCSSMRHQTLGQLHSYTINVPDAVATASGQFENAMEMYIVVEKNILADFIFYTASINQCNPSLLYRNMPCAAYNRNDVVLYSNIDELAFIDEWIKLGYPDNMSRSQYSSCCCKPNTIQSA